MTGKKGMNNNSPIKWTEEEDNFLKIHYPHRSNELLMAKLREINIANGREYLLRNIYAITQRANKLGLVKSERYKRLRKLENEAKDKKEREVTKIRQEEKRQRNLVLPQKVFENNKKYEK